MTIVELRTMNEKTVDTLAGEKWSVEAETLWTRLGEDDENDVSDGDDDNNAAITMMVITRLDVDDVVDEFI